MITQGQEMFLNENLNHNDEIIHFETGINGRYLDSIFYYIYPTEKFFYLISQMSFNDITDNKITSVRAMNGFVPCMRQPLLKPMLTYFSNTGLMLICLNAVSRWQYFITSVFVEANNSFGCYLLMLYFSTRIQESISSLEGDFIGGRWRHQVTKWSAQCQL